MNSAQRRKQRRAAEAMRQLRRDVQGLSHELARLCESTDHEIRKLTENAKRAGPVVAEFHIALRHVAEAITGVPPQFRDSVADINQLRLRLLAALAEDGPHDPFDVAVNARKALQS